MVVSHNHNISLSDFGTGPGENLTITNTYIDSQLAPVTLVFNSIDVPTAKYKKHGAYLASYLIGNRNIKLSADSNDRKRVS